MLRILIFWILGRLFHRETIQYFYGTNVLNDLVKSKDKIFSSPLLFTKTLIIRRL